MYRHRHRRLDRDTRTRAGIAALVYTMTSAVMFGAGLITVLSVPGLQAHLWVAIPIVVVLSLVLAAPAAWWIAPRLRARYWRRRRAEARRAAV
jgi:hypothetical protein